MPPTARSRGGNARMRPVRLVVAVHHPEERTRLSAALTGPDRVVVGTTGNGPAAISLVRQLRPDVALVDCRLEGLDGLAAARQLLLDRCAAVVVMIQLHHLSRAYDLIELGAAGCLIKPCSPEQVGLAVLAAARRREEWLTLARRAETAERRLAERRHVERAKALLMEQENLSEEEAYRRLRQLSMRTRRTMGDVAHTLLLNASLRPSRGAENPLA